MEKGKFAVNVEKKTVTIGHETKTIDGKVTLTTTFDFSNVSMDRLLKRAADASLITWRAGVGIKGITTAQALETLSDKTVDCSKTQERIKRVVSEEEAKVTKLVQGYMARGMKFTAAMRAALQDIENEELEKGEEQ